MVSALEVALYSAKNPLTNVAGRYACIRPLGNTDCEQLLSTTIVHNYKCGLYTEKQNPRGRQRELLRFPIGSDISINKKGKKILVR